jgi:hypothetical protein
VKKVGAMTTVAGGACSRSTPTIQTSTEHSSAMSWNFSLMAESSVRFWVLRLSMMLSTVSGGVVEKNDSLTSSDLKMGFIASETVWLDVVVLFVMRVYIMWKLSKCDMRPSPSWWRMDVSARKRCMLELLVSLPYKRKEIGTIRQESTLNSSRPS